MAGGRKKVTLRDIAEATGVSVNTVSRALRGEKNIAPDTLRRIEEARERMGYLNNTLASSLRRGYTRTLAVILGDIANPHFGVMMREIEARARTHGYHAFLMTTDERAELERAAIQSAVNNSVDGILICPCPNDDDNLRYLEKLGVPFVLIGRRSDAVDADYVICNDELGGYQAARAMIDRGHRRILTLLGDMGISSARERRAGCLRAHAEAGLPVEARLLREGGVMGKDNDALYAEILSESLGFTGVFAFSDLIAWDFWRFLHARGKSVPGDFSLVGFDNLQSRLPVPFALTSIRTHKGTMSAAAVDLLVRRMNGETGAPEHIVIDTALAMGETVRDLR